MVRGALAGCLACMLCLAGLVVAATALPRGGWLVTRLPGAGPRAQSGEAGTANLSITPLASTLPPVREGIWISRAEVKGLPISGPAWASLRAAAGGDPGPPSLCKQNSNANVRVLAKALVYARTGDERSRREVRQGVMGAIGTEDGADCRSLALGRELAAYVIAADLVGLDPGEDLRFRDWLAGLRTKVLSDGRSLVTCHETRPNNWGTMCGASRVAASAYLGDRTDLARAAAVFKGYLGDRSAYAGFDFGDRSWQADDAAPVGINPRGAVRTGVSIDGALPDDMRRAGGFTTGCPERFGYAWEALQGAVVEAEILHRQGYDAWGWQDQALRRALAYLYDLGIRCPAATDEVTSGDDRFTAWIVNNAYGTRFAAASPAEFGKIMGWTDWTHDRRTRGRASVLPSAAPSPQP